MKKWLKIIFVILTFALISVALYLVLRAFGIADLKTIKLLIAKSGAWGPVVYTLTLTVILVVFSFVPLLNTALMVLGIAIFGTKIAFITNLISIFCSNSILFFLGDKLGEKFIAKLIGQKTLEETQQRIDKKSKFWFPILFITPGVPDEALCLVAGMTKIKYWYLIIISLIHHSVEIAIFCFAGSNFLNWAALSVIDWIIVVNLLLIDIFLLFKFEKYIDEKTNKND